MNPIESESIGISKQRGLWLRCFLEYFTYFAIGMGPILVCGQPPSPVSPMDRYIQNVRAHRQDPAALTIAKMCGVDLSGALARYGFANDDKGTWRVVSDLPKAYDGLEMDLVDTAEVWRVGSRFLIEEWKVALDVGGFGRTLYCFDDQRKLQIVDSVNFQIPTDGGHSWAMHERWTRGANGRFLASVPFEFIDMHEIPTPPPQLDSDNRDFTKSWGHTSPTVAHVEDLKLPHDLLR
jgi:hypothetical protein